MAKTQEADENKVVQERVRVERGGFGEVTIHAALNYYHLGIDRIALGAELIALANRILAGEFDR